MKSLMFSTISVAMLAWSWPSWMSSLPSFDSRAALIVGAIVTIGAALVIGAAIITPFVAIQAGATTLGTCIAVAGIALVTGVIGGTAAGFYRGHQGDLKRQRQIENIKRVSNQLDIFFEPMEEDPRRAADFQCTLVMYEESDLAARQPTVTERRIRIKAANGDEFFDQLEEQMQKWFAKRVSGDADGLPRRLVVFMSPFPGEGVYESIKVMAEGNAIRTCTVLKVEGSWKSAMPD